jgi:hypothetical protein
MRPSMLWMLAACGLALTGLVLQYPNIYTGRHGHSRLSELARELAIAPDTWWEQLLWPLGTIVLIGCGVFAWLYWSTPLSPRRKHQQFPMDPPSSTEPKD